MDKKLDFTIVLEPAEEGGFVVYVPALPEVATCGDTRDEAISNAREAIELAIEHRHERGEAIPADRSPHEQAAGNDRVPSHPGPGTRRASFGSDQDDSSIEVNRNGYVSNS
jgi:antitoxin HicB